MDSLGGTAGEGEERGERGKREGRRGKLGRNEEGRIEGKGRGEGSMGRKGKMLALSQRFSAGTYAYFGSLLNQPAC